MTMSRKLGAEFIGTFWLVLGGCGSAVLAAGVPELGIGYAGVALAFGLTVLTGAYAFGHISGGHFNPAVTLGLFTAGRMPAGEVIPYWVAQVAGGIVAGAVLYAIASGNANFDADRRLRVERLWRTLAARLHAGSGAHLRSRDDVHVPAGDPGRDIAEGPDRIRAAGDRPGADPDPSDLHPGDEHVGQSGALDRRWRSSRAAGRSRSFGRFGSRRWSAARWQAWQIAGCPARTTCRSRTKCSRRLSILAFAGTAAFLWRTARQGEFWDFRHPIDKRFFGR